MQDSTEEDETGDEDKSTNDVLDEIDDGLLDEDDEMEIGEMI